MEIVGLERDGSMLETAYRKRGTLSDTERACSRSSQNRAACTGSMQTPPRTFVEMDLDACDPHTGTRLLRYSATC